MEAERKQEKACINKLSKKWMGEGKKEAGKEARREGREEGRE